MCVPVELVPFNSASKYAESMSLLQEAAHQKKKRLNFLNSGDGKRLHLEMHPHEPKHMPPTKWCVLCVSSHLNCESRRSSVACELCSVNLCIKERPGSRTCSHRWHKNISLTPPYGIVSSMRPGIAGDAVE